MTSKQFSHDIPVGDIQFYDDYLPAISAGNWVIEVGQTLTHSGATINEGDTLSTVQEFVVSGPQVHMDPSTVINKYPPNSTSGKYGEVLPHIVLGDPMFPWERKIMDRSTRQPWLALLVFSPDELKGPQNSTTRLTNTTVAKFIAPKSGVLKPAIQIEDDIDQDTQVCSYIEISTDTFKDVLPRLDELRFLSHCRRINTGDKAILGLNEDGLFSVVVANRFPEQPATGKPPAPSIVHLVSVEGFDAVLNDNPDFGSNTTVQLLTLASWTFSTIADNAEDFYGLFNHIVAEEYDGHTYTADNMLLRLPTPTISGTGQAQTEAADRVQSGFVPLTYHTRVGAETFAWYRGPLAPCFTTELTRTTPFFTSDAALIYDETFGVFDTSLATAWQIGRAVALSDKRFGGMVLDFRRRAHRITDALLHRLQSEHFSAAQIDQVEHDSLVQDEFTTLLNAQLLADIGNTTPQPAVPAAVPEAATPTDPKKAVQDFLAQPEVQATLKQLVAADLDPIAQWLARLLLLYPVPFNHLVPDPNMLPVESLRFFYLDNNWISALLDGALTIGMESSRDTFFYEMTHGILHEAAHTAAKFERSRLTGVDPDPQEVSEGLVSGFLLRSALVSGWPNLAVRPKVSAGTKLLKFLRFERLSPNVLFCLIDGVPDTIEFAEPQESFRFGVNGSGDVPLRNLVPPKNAGDPGLDTQLPGDPMFKVYDASGANAEHMRAAGSRVLNIDPSATTGLIQALNTANGQAHSPAVTNPPMGPGAFAMQMIDSPEVITWHSQS
ncbi:MAG: hypothetical protein AAF799_25635 [Myxococcota bacterium]